MERYLNYIGTALILIIIVYLIHLTLRPYISPVHFENQVNPYTDSNSWYIKHNFKYIETNRRIRDNDYIAGAWYRTEDPNIEVYLFLVEKEDCNMPVLYFDASEPNVVIWTAQHLLLNASGGPIRWPEADGNINSNGDIGYPISSDTESSDGWTKTNCLDVFR